jgi:hypothetical protein
MAHYLVKTYNTQGRLVGRFDFYAPSDYEAEGAVRDLGEQQSQELWCGARRVRCWPSRVASATLA